MMRTKRTLALAGLIGAVLACATKAPALGERLPGTYTAHETAATMTYVVKGDGTAALQAVTNLGEKIGAKVSYSVSGDTANVSLTPDGGGAAQSRKWTLRGDTLFEIAADKRIAFIREGR